MSFALLTRRHNSSFIKNVMDQVKKEVDHDPKMKQAWEDFAARKKKTQSQYEGFRIPLKFDASPLNKLKDNDAIGNSLKGIKAAWYKTVSAAQPVASKIGQAVEIKTKLDKLSSNPAVEKLRSTTSAVSSKLSAASRKLGIAGDEEKKVSSSFERWKHVRDATVQAEEMQRAKEEAEAAKSEAAAEASSDASVDQSSTSNAGDGLVVSDRGNSTWDRFGANMKDMPFLNAFFNNPLMDSLFGETEISASIRQMKENVDPNFRLDEFVEEIETIVTPKFVKWYLEGNAEKLKPHCGEAAFAAVNASIAARQKQRLELDTNILSGPSDFELKAAKSGTLGEDAAGAASPLFVFTFNAQQINCLRDADGNVVEGAVDDIRQLFYAIAVQRNPKANSSSALEFPWQIQEIAILGNQPCW
jgi:import inner membrane translocase subunit TIM44